MYTPSNIRWIKNIKPKTDGWAYENLDCKKTFTLHWPTGIKGSVLTAKAGDIIVLFQRPKSIGNRRNNKVYLTHLVSPINSIIVQDDSRPQFKWGREVKLIAKANPIDSISNPGYFNFFLPNRGATNPIINLENTIGLNEGETKKNLWFLFQEYFCRDIATERMVSGPLPIELLQVLEGDKIIRKHIIQELNRRDHKIVHCAKLDALTKGRGRILCECCDFDFLKTYGSHGVAFIECHHKIHLREGERITRISDLALVCSNCHRMLHRKSTTDQYYSVEDLKELILSQCANS